MNKFICSDCGHKIFENELLTAPHPFDPGEEISGCPTCLSAGEFPGACDEPGCVEISTCGTPTNEGYRRTCGKHRPEQS